MSGEESHKLTFRQHLTIAAVAGVFVVVAAWVGSESFSGTSNAPPPEAVQNQDEEVREPRVTFGQIGLLRQRVNQKFSDMETKTRVGGEYDAATFRFHIRNEGKKRITVERAEFIVDELNVPEREKGKKRKVSGEPPWLQA